MLICYYTDDTDAGNTCTIGPPLHILQSSSGAFASSN